MRLFHLYDTLVPVDPMKLSARLKSAGFINVNVELGKDRFRFHVNAPISFVDSIYRCVVHGANAGSRNELL